MKKNIFLYAGPHRSGSQFLQTHIFPHVPGLCTMRERDHEGNDIVMEVLDEHPMFVDFEAYRRRLAKCIAAQEEENILFSNEDYFGDYGKYISDRVYVCKPFYDNEQRAVFLSKLFDRPKVILTPRRQDLWVQSAYMHFVHNFHTVTFEEFFNPGMLKGSSPFGTRSLKPSLDYKTLDWGLYVENYFRIFGRENVLVVPHEMVLHSLHEALEKMYTFMGVEPYYPEQVPHINKSYSPLAYRLAMVFNRFVRNGQNPLGIIPLQPFLVEIQRMRQKKDTRLLWFLAGISRRVHLRWFLHDVLGEFDHGKLDLLGPERRQTILEYYKEPNRKYAELIGTDLRKYGYY